MSGQEHEKIKSLLESVPAGFFVDSAWLERHDIGRRSSYYHVKRGWLERVHRGVFRRPAPNQTTSNTLDWKTCLLSMQHIMDYKLHVGGMTALARQGHSHYLPLGSNAPVWVYGNDIPNWLTKLPLNAKLQTRSLSLFSNPDLGLTSQDEKTGNSASASLPWDWTLTMSSPERAILEALDELPDHESFHNLDMVFEGLANLRPKRMAALLKSCKKIKVTRLFFVFADRHAHAWRKRLTAEEFNLGTGDRALVKGGKIHPRYRIMVPAEFTRINSETTDGV
ncbi:type IV toxin-antitoxin system AbiEi family antitoxin domain-containing protein [Roseovarius pacificus]|uniref:type IV toxin-antitoxin system AbiEi family antitoxin domain-containing protein n=1 Tax=Roseovarius pacificus TaxID=337701 RepID=UPI002A187919|nr:type IV toxin-antitoxin system AbiEi family antitoxin domain-containing protein [Roseovarius pacificus]